MKICFIASGGIETASARIRAHWVAEHIPGAVVVPFQNVLSGIPLPDADVYIWQKAVNIAALKAQRDAGKVIAWDVTEPSWWWQMRECREIAAACDFLVASNQALADDLAAFCGRSVYTIPDRIDLDHYGAMHEVRRNDPLRFIWYGYSQNRHAIYSAVAFLERLVCAGVSLELTVMDDRPDVRISDNFAFPVYHVGWRYDREVDIISAHDIAVLPPYPGPWGTVKSNNRTLTAWACGLPVVTGENWSELWRIATLTDERQREQHQRAGELREYWDVRRSSREWMDLLGVSA